MNCLGREVLTSDAQISNIGWYTSRCRPLILIFAFGLTFSAQTAFTQDTILDFDILEQPLAKALERYGDITGRNVLYNSNLVIGRRSSAVQGHLSPDAALARLLGGTAGAFSCGLLPGCH